MISAKWLTKEDDLSAVTAIRQRVFVDELDMSAGFMTPDDGASILLLKDSNIPVATGRIVPYKNGVLLGQIAVLPEHRGRAYGDFLVRLLIRRGVELGFHEQYVYARPQAARFYEKLGFYDDGALIDGLIVMRRTGDVTGNC